MLKGSIIHYKLLRHCDARSNLLSLLIHFVRNNEHL